MTHLNNYWTTQGSNRLLRERHQLTKKGLAERIWFGDNGYADIIFIISDIETVQ